MYQVINRVIVDLNNLLTNSVLLYVLVGTGLWFSFHLRFIQVSGFCKGIKLMVKGITSMKKDSANINGMSSIQAFLTSLAAQIGTGNIVGVASAISVGGPGAVFWMWISAFLGMATIYAEAMMAQKFKHISVDGTITGGPVYYIKAAFKGSFGKVLSAIFAGLVIVSLGFMGNAVQANSAAVVCEAAFDIPAIVVGSLLALISLFVFWGGLKRIAKISEFLVPLMMVIYLTGTIGMLIVNLDKIPLAFYDIIVGAFNPEAVTGGAMGATIRIALSKGVARGLFSNEAGMGSTPHAHAVAKVAHPAEQGFMAMITVFIDTFVILTITALVIITTGTRSTGLPGADLIQIAFSKVYGNSGENLVAICMLLFAFTTIVGWYFFSEANIRYLFGDRGVKVFAILASLCVFAGSLQEQTLVWNLADCFNSLMVIPNIIGLIALTGVIRDTNKEYYNNFLSNNERRTGDE